MQAADLNLNHAHLPFVLCDREGEDLEPVDGFLNIETERLNSKSGYKVYHLNVRFDGDDEATPLKIVAKNVRSVSRMLLAMSQHASDSNEVRLRDDFERIVFDVKDLENGDKDVTMNYNHEAGGYGNPHSIPFYQTVLKKEAFEFLDSILRESYIESEESEEYFPKRELTNRRHVNEKLDDIEIIKEYSESEDEEEYIHLAINQPHMNFQLNELQNDEYVDVELKLN